MLCIAGITTEPKERKKAWEKQVVGFQNWRIVLSNVSREEAQVKEEVLVEVEEEEVNRCNPPWLG